MHLSLISASESVLIASRSLFISASGAVKSRLKTTRCLQFSGRRFIKEQILVSRTRYRKRRVVHVYISIPREATSSSCTLCYPLWLHMVALSHSHLFTFILARKNHSASRVAAPSSICASKRDLSRLQPLGMRLSIYLQAVINVSKTLASREACVQGEENTRRL